MNPPPEGYTKEIFLKGREPARATEVARVLARKQELHNLQNRLQDRLVAPTAVGSGSSKRSRAVLARRLTRFLAPRRHSCLTQPAPLLQLCGLRKAAVPAKSYVELSTDQLAIARPLRKMNGTAK